MYYIYKNINEKNSTTKLGRLDKSYHHKCPERASVAIQLAKDHCICEKLKNNISRLLNAGLQSTSRS